jgi:RNA polymerase sigma-70 factor, ECF subfamily
LTDLELARRCAAGDRGSQRALYERCCDSVYRLLYRMSRNTDDALDLAQETFVRVFERIGTFDGSSRLMTWVYRIAINEALRFRRRERLRARSLGHLGRRRAEKASGTAQDARRDVLHALARLPETACALLVLRYVEGMSYDEMSRILEKPPGSIASSLNRARGLLYQLLNAEYAAQT